MPIIYCLEIWGCEKNIFVHNRDKCKRREMCKGLNKMNKRKSAKFKKLLEQEKLVLEKQYRDLEEGNLHASQSEFSGEMPFEEEYAASGTTTFERERDLSLSENVKDILQRVNEALERIESGNFGICELCGESIPEERLQALPYANLCITCKQKEEKAFR